MHVRHAHTSRYTYTVMCPPADRQTELTSLIEQFSQGDRAAAERLLPVIYDDLHRVAVGYFRNQDHGHTLQPTALVNEAYLKLADTTKIHVRDRKHFFVLAARIMRQVLVDHARAKQAEKRGGKMQRVTLAGLGATPQQTIDVLALEDALHRMSELDPDRARLVELRFFAGLTSEEAAEVLGISRAEATRRWRMARAWLTVELWEGDDDGRQAVPTG